MLLITDGDADRCILVADCRYLPGQDPDRVIADVQGVIDRLAREDPELKASLKVLLHGEACQVGADTPLVATLQGAIETVIGHLKRRPRAAITWRTPPATASTAFSPPPAVTLAS